MGCENCGYAPTLPEEFLFSCIYPELYCPDAYSPNAVHCSNYNKESAGVIMAESEVERDE